ncbi:exocyst complex component EXO70E2-like [Miscanthus floridulus]|uniref:exocyst complex component EXO70E2-like n=1 Tax=Miscanthus floridulus TaxID=154761 RepID=UPI003457B1ED
MAAIWRRAWSSKKVSSAVRGYGARQPIFGSISTTTTSGSGTRTTTILSTSANTIRDEEEESAMELRQEEVVKTRRHMRGLVEEFRAGADGNATAPDRWLSDLHVAWLLRLAELDASGQRTFISRSRQLQSHAQTWIPALRVISTSVWKCLNGLHSDGEATVGPPATEFAQFLKATLLKMFTFVDAIVALDPLNVDGASATSQQHVPSSSVMGASEKVRALLDVRHALSAASEQIMVALCSSPYVLVTRVVDIEGLLSAQLGKLDQAVRDTFDHIRTAVVTPSLDDDKDSSATQTTLLQSSPAIHKVTRSVTNYINIVLSTEALLTVNYARHQGDTSSLTTLTMEVVGSLEEELARVSQSFPDQSLRFIFLINNSYLIRQLLDTSWPPHLHDLTYLRFLNSLTNRIDRYIQSYLQVSWAPVLECLHNPTFRCFTRDSPLPKFKSKFQSTYAAQKLWKVPDPELRKRLREAIIEKVVSGFTEYLEDNNRIIPGVSPQEVEEMLQELFEG